MNRRIKTTSHLGINLLNFLQTTHNTINVFGLVTAISASDVFRHYIQNTR
jgi:threonine/homoserine efflux transporter RhtA